jgi:serine/threonine protein kinase
MFFGKDLAFWSCQICIWHCVEHYDFLPEKTEVAIGIFCFLTLSTYDVGGTWDVKILLCIRLYRQLMNKEAHHPIVNAVCKAWSLVSVKMGGLTIASIEDVKVWILLPLLNGLLHWIQLWEPFFFLQNLIMQHVDHSGGLLIDLLQGLLKFEPSERLTAKEALKHPFFREPSRRL